MKKYVKLYKMSEVQEIPLDVEESPKHAEAPAEPAEKTIEPAKKATGRPKGVKDKAPRAKRAPAPLKAKEPIEQRPIKVVDEQPKRPSKRPVDYLDDSSSDESLDAAAMRRVMRNVKKQQIRENTQKQQRYASWFGR